MNLQCTILLYGLTAQILLENGSHVTVKPEIIRALNHLNVVKQSGKSLKYLANIWGNKPVPLRIHGSVNIYLDSKITDSDFELRDFRFAIELESLKNIYLNRTFTGKSRLGWFQINAELKHVSWLRRKLNRLVSLERATQFDE